MIYDSDMIYDSMLFAASAYVSLSHIMRPESLHTPSVYQHD